MSNMPHPFDLIAQLAEQFPAAFALAADARRPLAIGTHTNLCQMRYEAGATFGVRSPGIAAPEVAKPLLEGVSIKIWIDHLEGARSGAAIRIPMPDPARPLIMNGWISQANVTRRSTAAHRRGPHGFRDRSD